MGYVQVFRAGYNETVTIVSRIDLMTDLTCCNATGLASHRLWLMLFVRSCDGEWGFKTVCRNVAVTHKTARRRFAFNERRWLCRRDC